LILVAKEAFMPRTREQQNVPAPLHHRLNAYALAASAAGVSVLALVQPSEAEIVYTPADVTFTIRKGITFSLDLNGDGITDFVFGGGIDYETSFYVGGLRRNRVLGVETGGSSECFASALQKGRIVAKLDQLCEQSYAIMNPFWRNASERYLGLHFAISEQAHFGWARLTVHDNGDHVEVHLTAYAYESVPNQRIKAGQMSDDDATARPESTRPSRPIPSSFAPKPASRPAQFAPLGVLALGSDAIPLWRREELETKPGDNSGLTPSASF
jgi:hypothetical protein